MVIYKVFSDTCPSCKLMDRLLKGGGLNCSPINADEKAGRDFCIKWGVTRLPALVLVDGNRSELIEGVKPLVTINGFIKEFKDAN